MNERQSVTTVYSYPRVKPEEQTSGMRNTGEAAIDDVSMRKQVAEDWPDPYHNLR